MGSPGMSLRQRLLSRIIERDGHWLWVGSHRPVYGHGYIKVRGVQQYAHRVSYELFVGPIPPGLHLHHKCRIGGCINPEHLIPLTPKEHVRADDTTAGRNAKKTRCIHGHLFDESNTRYSKSGKRRCKTCDSNQSRQWEKDHPAETKEIHLRSVNRNREKINLKKRLVRMNRKCGIIVPGPANTAQMTCSG